MSRLESVVKLSPGCCDFKLQRGALGQEKYPRERRRTTNCLTVPYQARKHEWCYTSSVKHQSYLLVRFLQSFNAPANLLNY